MAAKEHRLIGRYIDKDRSVYDKWAELPYRTPPAATGDNAIDWSPGKWLSSWEDALPPISQPRNFYSENSGHKIWLLKSSDDSRSESGIEDDDKDWNQGWSNDDHSNMRDLAKKLISCWPNSSAEIAQSIGTTARELKWFLDGKADLDEHVVSKLNTLLGIEWVRESDGYDSVGPCVLIANVVGMAVKNYEDLSCGGDLEYSFEAVPNGGQADPSWRYMLFKSYGGMPCVLMFERGSMAADCLNDQKFINFEGLQRIPAQIYRDMVATCARACRSPEVNILEMNEFGKRLDPIFYRD